MSPDPMNSGKKPIFPPPPQFGQPEKPNWTARILFILFIVAAIGGIVLMIKTDPREKSLHCRSDVPTSMTSFGTCTEE